MEDKWDGLPPNPEQNGWHWLQHKRQPDYRAPWHWVADCFGWETGYDLHDPEKAADFFTLLGPCLTPAEVVFLV